VLAARDVRYQWFGWRPSRDAGSVIAPQDSPLVALGTTRVFAG